MSFVKDGFARISRTLPLLINCVSTVSWKLRRTMYWRRREETAHGGKWEMGLGRMSDRDRLSTQRLTMSHSATSLPAWRWPRRLVGRVRRCVYEAKAAKDVSSVHCSTTTSWVLYPMTFWICLVTRWLLDMRRLNRFLSFSTLNCS